ncbi:MAG: type II toxin-antitoxin system RelE/ParE family toxin [Lentisphaeraceae bacterium]|nr:type II toxin-antitoxin system RelE/ParE family toxin [Lentisphaeraceae bacterium]
MQYYDKESPGLGLKFLYRFEQTLEYILEFPETPVKLSGEVRKVSFEQFPFFLIYEIIEECLVIIAVAHQKRR